MAAHPHRHTLRRPGTPSAAARAVLGGTSLLLGLAAVYGGLMLIGDFWELSDDMLAATPFDSWTAPGLLLILVIGAPMLGASWTCLRRPTHAAQAAALAGAILVVWMLVQFGLVGYRMAVQPVCLAAGAFLVVAAWLVSPAPPPVVRRRGERGGNADYS